MFQVIFITLDIPGNKRSRALFSLFPHLLETKTFRSKFETAQFSWLSVDNCPIWKIEMNFLNTSFQISELN